MLDRDEHVTVARTAVVRCTCAGRDIPYVCLKGDVDRWTLGIKCSWPYVYRFTKSLFKKKNCFHYKGIRNKIKKKFLNKLMKNNIL